VTVTDANGCTATDVVTVTVNPGPIAHAGVDVELCIGESAVIGAIPAASGGTPPYSYLWTPIADLNDYAMANPTTSVTVTTTYTLTVDDANGCVDVDSMVVTVHPLPVVDIVGLAPHYCIDAGSITLTGNPTGGFWTGAGVFGSVFFPDAAGPGLHMITYTYTDQWGCTNSDTAFTLVTALPVVDAGPDVQIYKGHTTQLDATVTGTGPFIYDWQPPTGLNSNTIEDPIAGPEVSTEYFLTVTDSFGCVGIDAVWVFIDPNTPVEPDTTTPNVFTPEPADGYNDTWIIPLIDHFPDNTVTIYNRWGQVVRQYTNYSNSAATSEQGPWDGTDADGTALPAGTYFWVAHLADVANSQVNQLVHRGSITLIRHD
jgi:gliding motility-associated-like protein